MFWHSKTISHVGKILGKGSSTATWHIISDNTVKMEFSPHNLKIKTLTLLFSTFCHIQWACSIKMQINMSIQKEHLILKIRYSLLSRSLLQLFIEFTMLIDKQDMTENSYGTCSSTKIFVASPRHSAAITEDRRMSLEKNQSVQCIE